MSSDLPRPEESWQPDEEQDRLDRQPGKPAPRRPWWAPRGLTLGQRQFLWPTENLDLDGNSQPRSDTQEFWGDSLN